MPDQPGVADAIMCPRDYPSGSTDRDFARNAVFGPVLGTPMVHSCEVPLMPQGRSLVRRASLSGSDQTPFQFAKTDRRHPDMCHDWFVATQIDDAPGFVKGEPAKPADFAGSTILIGYLKETPNAG